MGKQFVDYDNAAHVFGKYAEKIKEKADTDELDSLKNGEINLAVNPTAEEQAKMNIWIETD